jgi:hypothetical protein
MRANVARGLAGKQVEDNKWKRACVNVLYMFQVKHSAATHSA